MLAIADVTGLQTTEFTRELLFLQVNHSDMLSGISLHRRDLVTAETEPLVGGEALYGVVDVSRVCSDQLLPCRIPHIWTGTVTIKITKILLCSVCTQEARHKIDFAESLSLLLFCLFNTERRQNSNSL